MAANSFRDSIFTNVGKKLFSTDMGINLSFNKFKLCATAGEIVPERTSQTNVKYAETITSASSYEDEDSFGYKVTVRIPSGALSTAFKIVELGLYSEDSSNNEVLCWVGKPDVAIAYTTKTDVTIDIYIPIEDQDITIDVETNPARLAEHNEDLNSHPYLLDILKNAGLLENKADGKTFVQINAVDIVDPVVGSFYYKRADGKYAKALNDTSDKRNAVGFYTEKDGKAFIRFGGLFVKAGAFTQGKIHYLSNVTPGGTTIKPYAGAIKVGTALDANTMLVDIDIPDMSEYVTKAIMEFKNTIEADLVITDGHNALALEPLTIRNGVKITIPEGSSFKILQNEK